jgi:Restriction endonuclease S subunits
MRNELKPYDNYKKAPFSWLDTIPSHWKYERAKAMYYKANRPVRETDEVVTCFRDGTVTLRKNRRTTGFTESIKEVGYQGIRKDDLVIHVMDAFAGAVGVSDSDGKGTPVYSVCIPKKDLNNYYYAYIVREMAKTGFIQSLYRGIRERSSDFRFEVFANQYLPIPPRDEQDQIVRYLDFQLAKINKFIKSKKKLITSLKEQKQIIINDAVTKGINPNVKMKPSGIEWLGDIPEHWSITRNKGVMRLEKDIVGDDYNKYTLLSLTTKGIIARDIESGKGKFPTDFTTYQVVNENDLVLCLFDIDETPRTVGLSKLSGMITGAYTVMKVSENCRDYVYYYYLALDQKKGLKPLYTGLRKIISKEVFLRTKLPYPSEAEQLEIVNFIQEQSEKIDYAIDIVQQEIDLMSEYRASFESDVVSGRIDVRNIIIDNIEIEDSEINDIDEEMLGTETELELEMGESED